MTHLLADKANIRDLGSLCYLRDDYLRTHVFAALILARPR